MFLPRILFIYFVSVFGLIWAQTPGIPYKDLKRPQIFDSASTNYEAQLYNAFSASKGSSVRKIGEKVARTIPVVGKAVPILNELYDLINPGSEWQRTVADTIKDVTDKQNLEEKIKDIKAALDSIIASLGSSSGLNVENVHWDTRKDIDEILNIFAAHKSLFKKYALIGSPLLIELARFVASLSTNINDHNMSCKIRNILLEYRHRAVDARFDKITSKWTVQLDPLDEQTGRNYDIPLLRSTVMGQLYDKDGYMDFARKYQLEVACKKYPKKDGVPQVAYVLDDEYDNEFYYGVDDPDYKPYIRSGVRPMNSYDYEFNDIDSYYDNPPPKVQCALDYFGFVRYYVEQMFPVEMFENFTSECGKNDAQTPTGRGYLTIRFKHASLVIENDGANVERKGDEPYIVVYVNGIEKEKSKVLDSCYQCDFNYFFESGLIDKNTKISFEIWDEDSGRDAGWKQAWDKDDKIVDSNDGKFTLDLIWLNGLFWLKQHPNSKLHNYMETELFWTDEYARNQIDDAFLKRAETNGR